MKKCGRNVLKTRRYDSALSTHFSFQLPLNSCSLSQYTVQRVRQLPSRESGTCMLCHLIYLQVVKVHLFNESLHFRSSFRKPKRFRLLSICANAVYNVISWIRIFCKDIHETLKYVDEFSELRKWRNSKRTHISLSSLSLSLSPLSLSTCRSVDALWFSWKDVHVPVSLSLSLYLHMQKRFGSRSDPNGIQERMFHQFKNLGMR